MALFAWPDACPSATDPLDNADESEPEKSREAPRTPLNRASLRSRAVLRLGSSASRPSTAFLASPTASLVRSIVSCVLARVPSTCSTASFARLTTPKMPSCELSSLPSISPPASLSFSATTLLTVLTNVWLIVLSTVVAPTLVTSGATALTFWFT